MLRAVLGVPAIPGSGSEIQVNRAIPSYRADRREGNFLSIDLDGEEAQELLERQADVQGRLTGPGQPIFHRPQWDAKAAGKLRARDLGVCKDTPK